MNSITICDARHPVNIDVKNGDSISLTSMSLIYEFYNITKPQQIAKYEHVKDENDKEINFQDYPDGLDFNIYYTNHLNSPKNKFLDKLRCRL